MRLANWKFPTGGTLASSFIVLANPAKYARELSRVRDSTAPSLSLSLAGADREKNANACAELSALYISGAGASGDIFNLAYNGRSRHRGELFKSSRVRITRGIAGIKRAVLPLSIMQSRREFRKGTRARRSGPRRTTSDSELPLRVGNTSRVRHK